VGNGSDGRVLSDEIDSFLSACMLARSMAVAK
jgi:hypothetical protein